MSEEQRLEFAISLLEQYNKMAEGETPLYIALRKKILQLLTVI